MSELDIFLKYLSCLCLRKWKSTVDLTNYSHVDKVSLSSSPAQPHYPLRRRTSSPFPELWTGRDQSTTTGTCPWPRPSPTWPGSVLSRLSCWWVTSTPRSVWSWCLSQLSTSAGEERLVQSWLVLTCQVRFAMQIVNGGGHSPHQEFPQVVNKHITKFIKGWNFNNQI